MPPNLTQSCNQTSFNFGDDTNGEGASVLVAASDTNNREGGSCFVQEDPSNTLPLCATCHRPLFVHEGNGAKQPDVAQYSLLIESLQKKVHSLQKALVSAAYCMALAEKPDDRKNELSVDAVCLPKGVSGKEPKLSRWRNKWQRAIEKNSTLLKIQEVASKFHEKNYRKLDELLFSHDIIDYINDTTNHEKYDEECVVPSVSVGAAAGCKAPADVIPSVDPVIFIDITSVMGRNVSREGAVVQKGTAPAESDGLESEEREFMHEGLDEALQRLSIENTKMHDEMSNVNRRLEKKCTSLREQRARLNYLEGEVERLNSTVSLLEKEREEACRQAKESVMLNESLKADVQRLRRSCDMYKGEAQCSQQKVRQLELELKSWDNKQRELERLRVLMRFSELKKDSDQLPSAVEQLRLAEEERDRLLAENRRCRVLIGKYRCQLEDFLSISATAACPATDIARDSELACTSDQPAAKPLYEPKKPVSDIPSDGNSSNTTSDLLHARQKTTELSSRGIPVSSPGARADTSIHSSKQRNSSCRLRAGSRHSARGMGR